MPYIGKQLKELRLEKGMTQEQLAQALNLSKSAVVQYEHDKREPSFNALIKIEKFFKVSAQYLTGKSQYKKVSEEIFYNESIEKSEVFGSENKYNQHLIIAISILFDDLLKQILSVESEKEKEQILKQLHTSVSILSTITSNNFASYPEMYESDLLSNLEFYKLGEKDFQAFLSQLCTCMKNVFDIRFEHLYRDYCKNYPRYSKDDRFIQSLKDYRKETNE